VSYSDLLRDPRWQRLRLEVFQRDDFSCQICGDKETSLQVHHHFYLKGRNPWDYGHDQLTTLCEPCHEKTSERMLELRVGLSLLKPKHVLRMIGYIKALLVEDGMVDDTGKISIDSPEEALGLSDGTGIEQQVIWGLAEKKFVINPAQIRRTFSDIDIEAAAEDVLP
jgi:hypothetical protein